MEATLNVSANSIVRVCASTWFLWCLSASGAGGLLGWSKRGTIGGQPPAPQRTTGGSDDKTTTVGTKNSSTSGVNNKSVYSLWERVIQRRRLQLENELTVHQRISILQHTNTGQQYDEGATSTHNTETIIQILVRHYQESSNSSVSQEKRQKSLVALRNLLSRIDDQLVPPSSSRAKQQQKATSTATGTAAVLAATIVTTPHSTKTPPPTKTHPQSVNDTVSSDSSSHNTTSNSSDDDLPIGTYHTSTKPNQKSGKGSSDDDLPIIGTAIGTLKTNNLSVSDRIEDNDDDDDDKDDLLIGTLKTNHPSTKPKQKSGKDSVVDEDDEDDLPIGTLKTKHTTSSHSVLDKKKSTPNETSVVCPWIAPSNDATATKKATPIPSVAPAASLVHQEKIATTNVAPSHPPPSSTPVVRNNNNNNTNQTKTTKQVEASKSLPEKVPVATDTPTIGKKVSEVEAAPVRTLAPKSIPIGNVQGNNTTESPQQTTQTKTGTTPSIAPPKRPPVSLLSTNSRGLESKTISKRAWSHHQTTGSSADKGGSSTAGIEKASVVNNLEKPLSTASTSPANQNPVASATTSSRTETAPIDSSSTTSIPTDKATATNGSIDTMGLLLSKTRKRTESPSEMPLDTLSDVSSQSSCPFNPPRSPISRKGHAGNIEVIEILDSPVSIQKKPPVQVPKSPVPKIKPPLQIPKSPVPKIKAPVQVSKEAVSVKKAMFVADSYQPTFSGTLATRKAMSLEYNAGDDKKTGSRLYSDQVHDMNVRFERWDPYWKVVQDCVCSVDRSGQTWGLGTGKVSRTTAGSRASMPFTAFSLQLNVPHVNSMRQVDWGGPRQSGTNSFTNGESRLIMRMLPLHRSDYEKKKKADTHLWPKGTFIQVNGSPVPIVQRRQQSHDHALWKGMCHVLDLTRLIQNPFKPSNILSVCTQDPDRYCVQIAVCKYVSSPFLFEEIKSSKGNRLVRNMSYEESLALASKHTGSAMVVLDSDDEGDGGGEAETGADNHSLTFTLTCPISMQLMKTPVR
eukprot:scaffold134982_cov55-Attheya_sp.AAC.2